MRVETERISDEVLELEEDVQVSAWDLDSLDVTFLDPAHLACKFNRIGKEIFVEADISAQCSIICSRCQSQARQSFQHHFTFNYDRNALSDWLEMDEDVREELLLNFPMKFLCSPECRGLCPSCGVNLNREQCRCQH